MEFRVFPGWFGTRDAYLGVPSETTYSLPLMPLIILVLTALLAGIAAPSLASGQCRVTGDVPASDLERALAACGRATDRFTLLFGTAPPAGTIEVSDTVHFFSVEAYAPEWKLVWPSSDRITEFFGGPTGETDGIEEAVETHWFAVLPHELGHLMLVAEEDARRPAERARRRLPDWLHEGTGVWMEPPSVRADELAVLALLNPYIPPLDSLLAFTIQDLGDRDDGGSTIIRTFFPCASEEACDGRPHWSRIFSVRTREFPDGRVEVDTTFHADAPPPPTRLGSHFYAYSATLVRYLFDRGGAPAMSGLLDRYVASADGSASLAGLPGLPVSRGRLEEDWRDWFRSAVFRE